jgi:hypothetical protein
MIPSADRETRGDAVITKPLLRPQQRRDSCDVGVAAGNDADDDEVDGNGNGNGNCNGNGNNDDASRRDACSRIS